MPAMALPYMSELLTADRIAFDPTNVMSRSYSP
jgi:hypothetical protein